MSKTQFMKWPNICIINQIVKENQLVKLINMGLLKNIEHGLISAIYSQSKGNPNKCS